MGIGEEVANGLVRFISISTKNPAWLAVLPLAVLAGFGGGALSARLWPPQVVVARTILVDDGTGKTRIRLTTAEEDGGPSLEMLDKDGHINLGLSSFYTGTQLLMSQNDMDVLLGVSVIEKQTMFTLKNGEQFSLLTSKILRINDSIDVNRVELGTQNGDAHLFLYNSNGEITLLPGNMKMLEMQLQSDEEQLKSDRDLLQKLVGLEEKRVRLNK
jgi:hypothetical protein